MKQKLRIVVNLFIAIIVPYAWLKMALALNGGVLSSAGVGSLKYFTVLSNLLEGLAALVWLVTLRRRPVWLPALGLGNRCCDFHRLLCFDLGLRACFTQRGQIMKTDTNRVQHVSHATHEFPPLYDADSRILILGSFPSVKSREQKFFYGHSQNRFWKILAALYEEPELQTIAEKADFAHRHHIALYDSIEECDITGSSDSSIKNVIPADLSSIFQAADIRVIFTNGKLSGKLFEKYQTTDIPMINLPSSSPANAAWSLERLIEAWKVIREWET